MVSPYRHISCITEQNDSERFEVNQLTQECIKILKTVNEPDGFNIGYNIGKAAGAGYDEHIHCHIVPRWSGDTNFMPVIGEVKVLNFLITVTQRFALKGSSTGKGFRKKGDHKRVISPGIGQCVQFSV